MKFEYDSRLSYGDNQAFVLDYEVDKNSQLHEGFVAINAIASALRDKFNTAKTPDMTNILNSPMKEFLEVGMDKYVSTLQRLCTEKSRGGPLLATVQTVVAKSHARYLYESLVGYRDRTADDVNMEMRNSMGNVSAMTRALEGLVADKMSFSLECTPELGIELTDPIRKGPIGFGRVLMESHEA